MCVRVGLCCICIYRVRNMCACMFWYIFCVYYMRVSWIHTWIFSGFRLVGWRLKSCVKVCEMPKWSIFNIYLVFTYHATVWTKEFDFFFKFIAICFYCFPNPRLGCHILYLQALLYYMRMRNKFTAYFCVHLWFFSLPLSFSQASGRFQPGFIWCAY